MSGAVHSGKITLHESTRTLKVPQVAPGDDLVLSNMYSLLNYIAAASKEIMDSSASSHLAGISQYLSTSDHGTLHSMEAGLRGMSDEEKRLVGISTIAVVTRLALEFKIEEVSSSKADILCRERRLNSGRSRD
jgi:phosphatidylinositol 4-kinase